MSSMLNMWNAHAIPDEQQPMREILSCQLQQLSHLYGFSTPYKRPWHHLSRHSFRVVFFFLKFRMLERRKVYCVNEYVYMRTYGRHMAGRQETGSFECRSLADIHL